MRKALPTIVYKKGGMHHGPPVDGKPTTYSYLGVKDELELERALKQGWSHTLDEAMISPVVGIISKEKAVIPTEKAPTPIESIESPSESKSVGRGRPTRDVLEAEAVDLGITVDGLSYREIEKLVIEARQS